MWEGITVSVPALLCRRCVRVVSRRVSDVPGVESLEVDAVRGVLRVRGNVDPAALVAALESDHGHRGLPGSDRLV